MSKKVKSCSPFKIKGCDVWSGKKTPHKIQEKHHIKKKIVKDIEICEKRCQNDVKYQLGNTNS